MKRLMIISSDSHACPPMPEFRPYLESQYLDEFEAFLVEYEKSGSRNYESRALSHRLDPEEVRSWEQSIIEPGRILGAYDLGARFKEMALEGIAADVVFPDFGRPFELLGSPTQASYLEKEADHEHMAAGNRAYNRWLVDFVKQAGPRFAAMAPSLDWSDADIQSTIDSMRRFKDAGFRGVVLPRFDRERPLYHPDYDPIWSAIEDMELVVNIHAPMSSTTKLLPRTAGAPHPGAASAMSGIELRFSTRLMLSHLIWGGVLERHPRLRVVFTEIGSGWTIGFLTEWDFTYTGSYLRRDFHDVIKMKPSDYFKRQCWLGSSTFSRAEVAARHAIGIDKMMIGMDYPHHEGTLDRKSVV